MLPVTICLTNIEEYEVLISIDGKICLKVNESLLWLAWHMFPNNSDRETVESVCLLD